MELFLTSSVHAVASSIAEKVDLLNRKKLIFIETAAEPNIKANEDVRWLENDKQKLISAGFDLNVYTISGKSKNELETDLANFDYIYMSGGNTGYLLEKSQESGFISVVKDLIYNKNKIYIGTSAGSIIAGPKLPDYFADEDGNLRDRLCYNFVNFTIMPHWGSEHFKERYLGERLKIAYTPQQVPLLLLTDDQYVHIKDEQMNIVDLSNL